MMQNANSYSVLKLSWDERNDVTSGTTFRYFFECRTPFGGASWYSLRLGLRAGPQRSPEPI